MNLYEVMMAHYAPKGSEQGVHTYLVADSDEAVYEWIKKEKELSDGRVIYNNWEYCETDGKVYDVYDDNYEVIGQETFKERKIRLKGELYDDENSYGDLYYGLTLLGWKVVKENIKDSEIKVLQDTGICIEIA